MLVSNSAPARIRIGWPDASLGLPVGSEESRSSVAREKPPWNSPISEHTNPDAGLDPNR
jgi:hypothetical protein